MKTIVRMLPVLVCLLMLGGHCASPTLPAGKSQDQPTQKLPATGASLEQTALHPTTIAATPTPVAARHLRLAFVRTWYDNRDVFIATMDGSEMINVSNHPARDKYPTWSPNGAYLAFTSMRDDMANVYVVRSDGSDLTRVSKDGGTGPAWSPDSTRLAFTGGDGNLYVVQPDGSHLTRLTHGPGEDVGAIWSPDGERIAFRTEQSGSYRISLMRHDGLHQTAVLTTSHQFSFSERMVWSPDGQQLAISQSVYPDVGTSIISRDGTLQTELFGFRQPAWLPEGDRLIGVTLGNDGNNLVIIGDDGTQRTSLGLVGRDPVVSPDGQQVAFVGDDSQGSWSKIYVANLDGTHRCQLTSGGGDDFAPTWSPDGSHITFIRKTGLLHKGGLGCVAIDGTGQRSIAHGVLSGPVWQPLPPQPESQVYFPLLMRSSGVGKGRY